MVYQHGEPVLFGTVQDAVDGVVAGNLYLTTAEIVLRRWNDLIMIPFSLSFVIGE